MTAARRFDCRYAAWPARPSSPLHPLESGWSGTVFFLWPWGPAVVVRSGGFGRGKRRVKSHSCDQRRWNRTTVTWMWARGSAIERDAGKEPPEGIAPPPPVYRTGALHLSYRGMDRAAESNPLVQRGRLLPRPLGQARREKASAPGPPRAGGPGAPERPAWCRAGRLGPESSGCGWRRRSARCAGSSRRSGGVSRTGMGRAGRASRSALLQPWTIRAPRPTLVSEGKPRRRLLEVVKAGVIGVMGGGHMASSVAVGWWSCRRESDLRPPHYECGALAF